MPSMPTGPFTCDVAFRVVSGPPIVREERDGVTYLTRRDYEIAYETILHFENGSELPIKGRLTGERNQKVVVRDAGGNPVMTSGYVQGRTEIFDTSDHLVFRGGYYDYRVVQVLTCDEALTPSGQRSLDHRENGVGEGPYAGHAFALNGKFSLDPDEAINGPCHGHID